MYAIRSYYVFVEKVNRVHAASPTKITAIRPDPDHQSDDLRGVELADSALPSTGQGALAVLGAGHLVLHGLWSGLYLQHSRLVSRPQTILWDAGRVSLCAGLQLTLLFLHRLDGQETRNNFV